MKRILTYLFAVTLLSQSISASVLVGKTEGTFSVSPTGAATYTIPIKVQKGMSDFVPSISISYNSQTGNGIAGMGFGISGLSAISIVPRSVYFDGQAEAIYTGEDNAFALDGMRLLLKSGENGQTGAVYRTENEQYNVISITNSQNGTPATFQVKSTDGATYKYGSSSGRYTLSNGEAYSWALDYAEDALGNYISYTYSQEGILYPTSITYGRNTHGTAGVDCTISFTYESRPDSVPTYIHGEQRFLKKRLKSIVCKYNGNIYRTYTLNYTEDVFSHLISVTETGESSSTLPPTTFEWEVPTEFQLSCSSRYMDMHERRDSDIVKFFSADLDGDGNSEIISMERVAYDVNTPVALFYVRKYNPSTQSFIYTNFYHVDTYWMDLLNSSLSIHACHKTGNSLVLPYCRTFPNISTAPNEMHFVFPEENKEIYIRMKGHTTDSEKYPAYTFLDSDGDGLDNIFVIEKEEYADSFPAYLATFDISENTYQCTQPHLSLQGTPDKIRSADFNADGMPDLLITTSSGYYIYWNKNGRFSDSDRYPSIAPNTAFKKCDIIEAGDFDGDGLVDLIINKHDSNQWFIARNTGSESNGYFSLREINALISRNVRVIEDKEDKTYCLVQDIDGDGKSDAIVGYPNSNDEGGNICILRSNGNTLVLSSYHQMPDPEEFPNCNHIVQGIFDGDGGAQILYKGKSLDQDSIGWHILDNPTIKRSSQKVISITDGLGARDSISYGLLTDNNVYSLNDNTTLPQQVVHLAGAMPVVKTRTESIPSESRTTDYSYTNGLVHLQGKGFLGFEDIKTESSTGIVTDTHCRLDSTFYVLLPNRILQSNDSGVLVEQENIGTGLVSVGTRSYTTNSAGRYTNSPLEGFGKDETCRNYLNGNPRARTVSDGLLSADEDITYWESLHDSVWIKCLPAEIETYKYAQSFGVEGDDVYERVTYERDPSTGLVLKEIKRRNGMLVSTDGYSYNEYGQMTRHYTVPFSSADTLLTRYEYDTYGRLKKEYNPKGLYRIYSYNSTCGTLTSVRDYDGVTTHYTYDGFLRETKRYSDIESCQTTRALSNYGGGKYFIKETITGKTPAATYYDAWERKIAESALLADGVSMYTDYHYCSNGKLGFVSFPHKSTEASSGGTTYTYDDPAQRLTSTVDSNGKMSTWSYPSDLPNQVVSCIDGVTTTTNYYTSDKVHVVEDANGGIAEYFYNVDGNISSIGTLHDGGGSDYEMYEQCYEYDSFGRLIETTDVNGVTKQYSYNSNGYPYRMTIGGSYVETNYDKYGILRSKSWADSGESPHIVSYTYDSKFRLTRELGEGYLNTYTYDTYGRMTNKYRSVTDVQTVDMNVSIQYGYDNHISSTTSSFNKAPTTVTERFSYNNGYKVTNALNDSTVWSLTKQDRWGNVTETLDSLGITVYSYDDYGNMLSMSRSGNTSVSETYTYNIQTGNMNSKNGTTLSYDSMNQLTGWGDKTFSYDYKGNITHQPFVGNFSYDGFRVDGMTADVSYVIDDSLRITYYKAIERPKSVENEHYKADFYYDGNGDRYMMKVYKKIAGGYRPCFTRYYLDANAEVTLDTISHYFHMYYAGGDAYTAPAVMEITPYSPASIYQITRDNLGSALLYENANGVRYQYSYSPWGVRTHLVGDSIRFYLPGEESIPLLFYRTYTGHEDLWMFGLLNANARLYSPYLGRFISPDPLLNSEGGALDYNPYIYARNNPYKYIDRNGEFWWLVAAVVFGGFGNVFANFDSINNAGDFFKSFGIGAGAGALGGWLGPAAAAGLGFGTTGFISGAFTGAITGFTSNLTEGLLNWAISGTKFSFTNLFMQTAFSAAIGGIMGGIDAVCHKKSFWHGYDKQTIAVDTGHPVVGSKGRNNCVGASLESMTDGEVIQEQVRDFWNKHEGRITDPNTEGMDNIVCYKHTASKVGRQAEWGTRKNPQYIFDGMTAGDDFGITYAVSGVNSTGDAVSGWHNVLMKKASQTTWFKPNGTMIIRKPKLWVMDPAHGGSIHRIYKNQLEHVIRVF